MSHYHICISNAGLFMFSRVNVCSPRGDNSHKTCRCPLAGDFGFNVGMDFWRFRWLSVGGVFVAYTTVLTLFSSYADMLSGRSLDSVSRSGI